jgi:hypothetical protein
MSGIARGARLGKLASILVILSAVATAGCGILSSRRSVSSSRSSAAATTAAPTSKSTTPTDEQDEEDERPPAHGPRDQLEPVSSGAPGSPQAVLHRYAVLYGNLCSCSRAAAALNELAALATPELAAELRQAATSARLAVAHGLPDQARAVASVDNLELAPTKGGAQTGLIVLVERTIIPRRPATGPRPVVYTARLANTTSGWRVASFTPVIPTR